MKGSPLKEWFVLIIATLLLSGPMIRLTKSNPAQKLQTTEGAQPAPEVNDILTYIDFRFSHAPNQFQLSQNGTLLWQQSAPVEKQLSFSLPLQIQDHECDLTLEISWPEDQDEAAAQISIEPEGFPMRTKTLWGRNTITKPISFRWH